MKTKIYLVSNIDNDPNKVYIGKTKNSREKDHKINFGDQIKYEYIDEIDSLDSKDWKPLETKWIQHYLKLGYTLMNKQKVGGSGVEFHSEETKNKMSLSRINRKITWGDKISESKKNSTYRHPKEILDKISQTHSKPIEQYTPEGILLNTFPSAMEAMRQTGVKNDNINQNLRGKSKSAGGFVWKYK